MTATLELELLRSSPVTASPIGVDREKKIIRGFVVAEVGDFKTRRGAFDQESLSAIENLLKSSSDGAKSHYGHQITGTTEALDAFLGRAKDPWRDGSKVRADLHLDPVAMLSPNGGTSRGEMLMTRAESDPNSFGSSLVVAAKKTFRLDARGRQEHDELGVRPPIWTPLQIAAVDVVDAGDAVHGGFLAASDAQFLQASTALDTILKGLDRDTLDAFFDLYLTSRFGPEPAGADCADMSGDELETIRLKWRHTRRKAGL